MIKWQKLIEEYSGLCQRNGFYGAAFRLAETDLSLSEATNIVSEMEMFLHGYQYAAERSIDKDKLLSEVDSLLKKTFKLKAILDRRKEINRTLLK